MLSNDSVRSTQQHPPPPPSCRLSSLMPLFMRDCVWLMPNVSCRVGEAADDSGGFEDPMVEQATSHNVPHLISLGLGAANAVGIAIAVCVYAALIRRRCHPTYNLMLLLLCALDLLHQASSATVCWLDWYGRVTDGSLMRGDGHRQRVASRHPIWRYPDEGRMRAAFEAAALLRLLCFAAYPCRNYWVAYICTFRCRLIWRPSAAASDEAAAATAGRSGIGRLVGPLCARAGAIFIAACVLIGLWQAASGGTETVFHCRGDQLQLSSGGDHRHSVMFNGSGIYATKTSGDFACGESLNAALKASHFVLTCLLPICVVLLGTCLSLRGLRRSNFAAERYGRARRLLIFTCGAFVCLEVPYAVAGLASIVSSDGGLLSLAQEASQLLCSFNSTVILCLNVLSNRAVWQQAALAVRRATCCRSGT